MICQRLAALAQAFADWLDPARANIRAALRDADTMQAIQREHLVNISNPRSMGDEVNKMLAERDAELRAELADLRGRRPTRFARGLRAIK